MDREWTFRGDTGPLLGAASGEVIPLDVEGVWSEVSLADMNSTFHAPPSTVSVGRGSGFCGSGSSVCFL